MPTLAVTKMSWPSIGKGADSTRTMLWAAVAAAAGLSSSLRTTVNSSPPQAGHGVVGAHGVAHALGHGLQQAVADIVAEVVVDVFEAVQVHEQHGDLLAVAGVARLIDAAGQQLEEQRAVGQVGQHVVVGQVADALLGAVGLDDAAHPLGQHGVVDRVSECSRWRRRRRRARPRSYPAAR